ncbi:MULTISPECIES: ankyrin repeat domain-containing protein [unclassified Herbaspirillum]|uniref:ankyrin repeat domain-containing protein n=1 Tax=unclassified Herbaspirillum TaxID=2624150 RepID=UPI002101EF0D|nr:MULTISPECIES: ankyrin repeat domain-containing protein [unclassified Herbaspirillum]
MTASELLRLPSDCLGEIFKYIVDLPDLYELAGALPPRYRGEVQRVFRFAHPISKTKQWLQHCIQGENESIMRFCLENSVDNALINTVNARGLTALMLACEENKLHIVELLLPHAGLDINLASVVDGRGSPKSALSIAVEQGCHAVVEKLLQRPEIDVNAGTPLVESLLYEQLNIYQLLLRDPRTDINGVDEFGDTALVWVAQLGDTQLIEQLLAFPLIDPNRGVPLIQAAMRGELNTIRLLLAHERTDINCRDMCGSTALLEAARYGHLDVVTELLSTSHIDIGVVNAHGETELGVAPPEIRQQLEMLLQERARSQSR